MNLQNFKPINRNILVKIEKQEENIVNGIFVGKQEEDFLRAEVITLGTQNKDDNGNNIDFMVKSGDKVLIMKFGPIPLKIDNNNYSIITEDHIIAILE